MAGLSPPEHHARRCCGSADFAHLLDAHGRIFPWLESSFCLVEQSMQATEGACPVMLEAKLLRLLRLANHRFRTEQVRDSVFGAMNAPCCLQEMAVVSTLADYLGRERGVRKFNLHMCIHSRTHTHTHTQFLSFSLSLSLSPDIISCLFYCLVIHRATAMLAANNNRSELFNKLKDLDLQKSPCSRLHTDTRCMFGFVRSFVNRRFSLVVLCFFGYTVFPLLSSNKLDPPKEILLFISQWRVSLLDSKSGGLCRGTRHWPQRAHLRTETTYYLTETVRQRGIENTC